MKGSSVTFIHPTERVLWSSSVTGTFRLPVDEYFCYLACGGCVQGIAVYVVVQRLRYLAGQCGYRSLHF